MNELRTEADINDMALLLQGYACDLYALEQFHHVLQPGDVDEVGDTQDPGFYNAERLGAYHEHADYLREQGVDLGNQFDFITQTFAQRAVYDADAYSAVLQGLNQAIAALQINGAATVDAAIGEVEGSGTPDGDLPNLTEDWTGSFIDNLKNDVIDHVPYHRPYHLMLISQLAAAIRSQMNLHETYRQRLYEIAEVTKDRIRSVIYDEGADDFDVTTRILGIALAVAGVATTVITGGASLSITMAVLGAGLTTATNVKLAIGDFAKGQEAAKAYESAITGFTSTDIVDSMMQELSLLDADIKAEESALGRELGNASSSLSSVVTAANQTEGLGPDWTPWRVRSKRTNLADEQPDSSSEMAHDESNYLT